MRTVEVHYEITGASGSPVLLLAAPLGSALEIWDPLVEALSERFRVVRDDHCGHGRSPAVLSGGSQDSGTPVNPYAKTLATALYRAKLEFSTARTWRSSSNPSEPTV